MQLAHLPFFQRLSSVRRVLIAGAGGGFDVYAGAPIGFALEDMGAEVHYANLSFTSFAEIKGERPTDSLVEIHPDTRGPEAYFPELYLAQALGDLGSPARVFAFPKTGVRPLRAAYQYLVETLRLDAVVLVDGGTDSLLFGDEADLGTPEEDMTSVAAANGLKVPTRLLASIGFGVDSFHGVSHHDVLENVAQLTRDGGFLGAFSLLPGMPEFSKLRVCLDRSSNGMPRHPSIVNSSIQAAVEGEYGDHHRTVRTHGSELWINPLMALYFTFELSALARRVEYLPQLEETRSAFEVSSRIEAHRNGRERYRPRKPMPG